MLSAPSENWLSSISGIRSSDSPGPFILSLIFIKVPFPYLSVLCEQLRQVKWPVTELYPSLGYIKLEYSVSGMNVDANRTCGKCLSQIRREQGITQVELAKKLGVPQSFISKVETGERSLRVYEQFVYADALGITVETLVRKLGAVLSSEDN